MTAQEIISEMESIGFTEESIKEKKPLYSGLVYLATYFYARGVEETVKLFSDNDLRD